MAKLKGLGRGLDALLSSDIEAARSTDALRILNVAQLQPGKYQPRTHMDDATLQTLAESIKTQGIMQPILVREVSSDKFEIIAGERRWRASKIAGLEQIPVLVRDIADESALAMALIENIQRENLNPLEEAQGIKRLIDEFAMTHEKAAEAVGRSRVAVSNLLRLLSLSSQVQEMLMQNKLDMGHARALVGLDAAQQIMFANKIVQQNLSVREVEKLVKLGMLQAQNTKNKLVKTKINHDLKRLQETVSEQIGMRVNIQHQDKGKGKLIMHYQNLDELDRVFSRLGIKLDA